MNKHIELLAPAGEWDAFAAAVENGADAVYLGGTLFNARQFAGNFDSEQLKKAVEYGHIRDVKIYLTLNTLLTDDELGQAAELLKEAYLAGIDGVIVQDMGVAAMIRKLFPELELHASTQMTVYNLEGVQLLEQLGFKRAVLARELSLDEISAIAKNTSIDIEVFIHGALCICYSGQCLMSSIIGGRSGNRGKCAQPCRLPYDLIKSGQRVPVPSSQSSILRAPSYLLSPKDLCSLEELKGLADAGVKSLKIEGRMKSPEYVATVVRIYRKHLDRIIAGNISAPDEKDIKELTQIFNRGGFSKGYLKGKTGRDMMTYEKPKNWGIYLGEVISYDAGSKLVKMKLAEDLNMGDGIEIWTGEEASPGTVVSEIRLEGRPVKEAKANNIAMVGRLKGKIQKGSKVYKTTDAKLNAAARESFQGRTARKTPLSAKMSIKSGSAPVLEVMDNRGNTVKESGEVLPEPALNRPLTKERIIEQLNKTGSTPFEFTFIDIELDESMAMPVSEINNIRRRALEKLEKARRQHEKRILPESFNRDKLNILARPKWPQKKVQQPKVSIMFQQWLEEVDYSSLGADRLYLPFSALLDVKKREKIGKLKEQNCELYVWLPSITRGNYDKLIKSRMHELVEWGIDGVLAANAGSLGYISEYPALNLAADYTLNVFNSLSEEQMSELEGIKSITLSPELTLSQLTAMEDTRGISREVIVYGRIPLMTSEYCPVGSIAGGFTAASPCSAPCTTGSYTLKDRKGVEFPVICDRIDCRSTIMNTNVLFIPDTINKLTAAGFDILRLNITDESTQDIKELVQLHKDAAVKEPNGLKKHEGVINRVRDKGFTKGHYFRGV